MWHYQNNIIDSIEQMPPNVFGFIYRIVCIDTGKFYIGKKQLLSTTNVKLGKKAKAKLAESITGKGRRPSKQKVIKESNWLSYYGSSKQLLEDVKKLGETAFKREIIQYCYSKKSLSYAELKHLILNNWSSEQCYNENVLGKYFKTDV